MTLKKCSISVLPAFQTGYILSPTDICDLHFMQGCGSGGGGPFSVETEAEVRKIHRFHFHIGGKNGERKEIGSAILCRRTNRGSINIKK